MKSKVHYATSNYYNSLTIAQKTQKDLNIHTYVYAIYVKNMFVSF